MEIRTVRRTIKGGRKERKVGAWLLELAIAREFVTVLKCEDELELEPDRGLILSATQAKFRRRAGMERSL